MPPTPPPTLFPYTTLFRSALHGTGDPEPALRGRGGEDAGRSLGARERSEEHTSELQLRFDIVCRLLLEKRNEGRRDGSVARILLRACAPGVVVVGAVCGVS